MAQLFTLNVFSIVLHLLLANAQQLPLDEGCPKATRPHMTRCDQYYRCTVLSKDAHVWVATQCQKGLVYLHHLGTCVVPDNDWECDISAENERNHSEENVYGIDNLNVPSTLPTNSNAASEESSKEANDSSASKEDNLKSHDPTQNDLNDMESSGDGSLERANDEPHTVTSASIPSKAPAPAVTSTMSPGTLNPSMLDSFLAYYDTQNALKLKTKQESPPKMDEQNYLDHLKQIVNQQKQLNEMARIPSQTDMFQYKTVPVQQLTAKKETVVDEPLSKLNLSPGMQDIIRSILDISQKAIANQNPSAASPAPTPEVKDPVVKPIFIPISVNPVPAPSVPTPATTEQPLNAQYSASYNMGSSGPPSLGQNAMQNSFRINDTNDAQFHVFPQQVLYDAYGNKYVPKDAYQPMSPTYTNGVYNPYLKTIQPHSSLMFDSSSGSLYSNTNGLTSPMHVQPSRFTDPLPYFHSYGPSSQRITPLVRDYDAADDIIDQMKLLESIESLEGDGGQDGSLEKDLPLPVTRHSVDFDDAVSNEDGQGDGNSPNTKYTRKLFTLGDMTFDYEQYKDSMLPLVDANPNDERISIVVCTVGSRQPNNTDCFRYYICNPHNGVFQSYTCPPSTAFNKKSRMCDVTSYKQCKQLMTPPAPPRSQLRTRKQPAPKQGVSQINQIQQELWKAQKYVELIRLEANKLRLHNSVPSSPVQKVIYLPSMGGQTAVREQTKVKQKQVAKKKKRPTTGSKRITAALTKLTKSVPRCRLEGRMPDPMDKTNYYVCHRKSPNKFIKIKMACPVDLLYCAETQYCTLTTNC